MSPSHRNRRGALGIVAALLLFAGCSAGGSDDSAEPSTSSTTEASSAPGGWYETAQPDEETTTTEGGGGAPPGRRRRTSRPWPTPSARSRTATSPSTTSRPTAWRPRWVDAIGYETLLDAGVSPGGPRRQRGQRDRPSSRTWSTVPGPRSSSTRSVPAASTSRSSSTRAWPATAPPPPEQVDCLGATCRASSGPS